MLVHSLMTEQPRYCTLGQRASDAARSMWDHDIGCIPVVDHLHVPIGVVTDRDICMATYTQGVAPAEITIEQVMSRTVHTCRPTDTVASAEHTMRTHQVRRLPVVDAEGKLIGILSLNDLVLAGVRSPIAKVTARLRGDVHETLAAVCRRRPPPVGMQI